MKMVLLIQLSCTVSLNTEMENLNCQISLFLRLISSFCFVFFYFYFYFKKFYWSIVALQYRVSFYCTAK